MNGAVRCDGSGRHLKPLAEGEVWGPNSFEDCPGCPACLEDCDPRHLQGKRITVGKKRSFVVGGAEGEA